MFWRDDWRHLALKGGRGAGAKSRTVAKSLLILGTQSVRRVLCARETMRSMKDSVKALLDDEINRLGLGYGPGGTKFYRSTRDGIYGANGTRFIFSGLKHDIEALKSLEGITDVWIEEARKVSQESLDALEPTIRAEGSRLTYTYNARLPTDPVDNMFFSKDGPPPRSLCFHLRPDDNPWFPDVLREKMEYDKRRDYARYLHIWMGEYWERDDAKVFTDWEIADFDTPEDAVLRFGADWGFSNDPTVLIRAFIGWWKDGVAYPDYKGDTLFFDHEAYKIGCTIDNTPALFAGSDIWRPRAPRWTNPLGLPGVPGAHKWKIIADSARPEIIKHMTDRAFDMEAAVKGPGSVEEGVTFLQNYHIVCHERCGNTADELATYSYKVDKQTEKVIPQLADKDNHVIDAARYALENVRKAMSGEIVIASASPRELQSDTKRRVRTLADLDQGKVNVTSTGFGTVAAPQEEI